MMNCAEAYMQEQREEFQEEYYDELPSLCHHLVEMIVSERYVFSADFLAREYRFDRMSAEKIYVEDDVSPGANNFPGCC